MCEKSHDPDCKNAKNSIKSIFCGAREQNIFLNLFLCDRLITIYSDDRFQIFRNFFFDDFSNFSLSNDGLNGGLKFLNFSKFSKFLKLLTRPNFENFDRIFRELHRTRNRDLSVSVA